MNRLERQRFNRSQKRSSLLGCLLMILLVWSVSTYRECIRLESDLASKDFILMDKQDEIDSLKFIMCQNVKKSVVNKDSILENTTKIQIVHKKDTNLVTKKLIIDTLKKDTPQVRPDSTGLSIGN